jgi:soluble P-type ATPase
LIYFQTKKYFEKQPFSYPQTPSSLNLIIMAANKFVMIGDIVLEIHTYIHTYICVCVCEREREREREREARTTSVYEIEM